MAQFILSYSGLGDLSDLDIQKLCNDDEIEILDTTCDKVHVKASARALAQLMARLSTEWTWTPVETEVVVDQPIIEAEQAI